MEYQVTATRRRPQRFEDLLGQEFVAATLQKSIEAGKIAHAYLFSGPRGCGKTSSARILAKVLNCAEGPKPTPCGKCTACEEITAGSCLDVIEIDGASNTSVNDVRQIKDEILFPPNSSRYKIYIIDEVHMLSTSAFNALLKTIEEPPPYVVFIFATTEIHKVPATIKSRCQQFNFKLVSIEILKKALGDAASELGITADDEALYWIAREATGSVRDAYTLFDQVAAFSDGHITFEKIHEKLGLTGVDSINKLVSACVAKNGQEALSILDGILQGGISVEQVVSDCADYFRSLLLVKHGITKEALIGQRADRFPQDILQGWDSAQIERALSIMLQLFKDLRFSIDQRYELELAVSRLSWLSDYVSPAGLKAAFDAAQSLMVNHKNVQLSSPGRPPVNQVQTNLQNRENTENPQSFNHAGSLTEQFKAVLKRDNKLDEVSEKKNEEKQSVLDQASFEKKEANEKTELQTARIIENNFTVENLKEPLIEILSEKSGILSSAVGQSKDWLLKEDSLTLFVRSSFDLTLIQKQKDIVAESIFEITGKKLKLIVKEYIPPQTENKTEETAKEPEKIRTIADVFMGKIVECKNLVSEIEEGDENEVQNVQQPAAMQEQNS
ncbi:MULTISPECIES: DNA polymerase III subunit gamma/tau [unclassified Treponema]|uniref:DNA polymerase III subunit gamma/tau n=1 Tax=unclassified Treponema TaxID=2638727 RepID=UPI0020A5FC71|nr:MULTISPECIES: DNA polymerase III subunit gamma/tau [unclassified Treponema]UTC66358.1 DNA polymerase III subunit gamma/tau [Treponema sp. OMZ 789]UTC69088.1 DNA polymerase III subunit gamma/tau [Treponema sp. OMZ 790]UTC71800.1 DNA polymerase III subunit gamma/tau [Treponema sp. OMZ 791]